jgi:TetR/AcrR family transcriptional regulator, acrAB operon repressor
MGATRRAQTSSESRHLLITAAAELFAEQGFRKTTVADVAERAGISRGSIPWHFGNKDGLLEAVVAEFSTTLLDATEPPAGSPLEVLDQARDFVRQPTTRLLITLLAEAVEPGSPVHGFYAELHRLLRKSGARGLERVAMPTGVSREEFTAVLIGAVIGVHQQWRVSPADIDLDRVFEAMKVILSKTSMAAPGHMAAASSTSTV